MNEAQEWMLDLGSDFAPRWLRKDYDVRIEKTTGLPGLQLEGREERTGPYAIPGSSLKGALRCHFLAGLEGESAAGEFFEAVSGKHGGYRTATNVLRILCSLTSAVVEEASFPQGSYACSTMLRPGRGMSKTCVFRWLSSHARSDRPTPHTEVLVDALQGQLFLPAPVLTIEERLNGLLDSLELQAEKEVAFDESATSLRRLAEEHPEIRTRLYTLVQEPERHPRLRWFGFEVLSPYELPGFLTLLIEAIQHWPEDMTLVGATVALRLKKVPADARAQVREALLNRLRVKAQNESWRGEIVIRQLVSQWLGALGSFGIGEDLDLLRHFWMTNYDFVIRTNALEAAIRLARRECEREATAAFFKEHTTEFEELAMALALVRGANAEMGSFFWSMIELLAVRLGDEISILETLAKKHPSIRRRLAREIVEAESKLERRHADWLRRRAAEINRLRPVIAPDA